MIRQAILRIIVAYPNEFFRLQRRIANGQVNKRYVAKGAGLNNVDIGRTTPSIYLW
ncbi:MAG: hypothetical protein ABSE81_04575 [Candidatus Omnitrophota bacterium]